jgi:hypothetical protein
VKGGTVVGESDPEGQKDPTTPVTVGDLHATVLKALGIDWAKLLRGPLGRTVARSSGTPVAALVG